MVILGLNIEETVKLRLKRLYEAKWVNKNIQYLGIKILINLHDLLMDNIIAYKNKLDGLFNTWQKLPLSWWGRSMVIKMKILPVLIFLFQNLIIPISMKCVEEIRCLLNTFLWQGRKARIKMSWLQQRLSDGGIAFPSVKKYYLASRLTAMKTWWKEENGLVWDIEQHGIPMPLREWVLTDPVLRASGVHCT